MGLGFVFGSRFCFWVLFLFFGLEFVFGFKFFPLRFAGHTSVQRPHSTQVKRSYLFFMVISDIFPKPKVSASSFSKSMGFKTAPLL